MCDRKANLLHRYGITLKEYAKILKSQGGRCKICRTRPYGRKLVVDHNHLNKQVRALLCHSCNIGIGMFRDSVALLGSAIQYLRRYDESR